MDGIVLSFPKSEQYARSMVKLKRIAYCVLRIELQRENTQYAIRNTHKDTYG